MSTSSTEVDALKFGKTIHFDDFEISWAGANPVGGGYCFGSEDGRFRILATNGQVSPTKQVTTSDESVNGVAFSGRFMAVSTRCEIVFHDLDPRFREARPYIYNGGAHGVLATSAGGFVAPLGMNGLLRVPEIGDTEARFLVNTIRDNRINLYQIALLHGDGKRDFIAAAARDDGIHTFDLNSEVNAGRPSSAVYFKGPGLDVVSLCSLESRDHPFSLAALGRDGSVHLFRDIQAREEPSSLRLDDLLGSPYSILHSQGHLFILTSKGFYACPNLASQFLAGNLGGGLDPVRKWELRAVDIYAIGDEIAIEMANHLLVAKANDLISEPAPIVNTSSQGMKLEPVHPLWTIDRAIATESIVAA